MTVIKNKNNRVCAGCGVLKEKKNLIRIVRTTEGTIEIDYSGKINGRGAYICMDNECLKKAKKKKALERSFKRVIDENVYERISEEILKLNE